MIVKVSKGDGRWVLLNDVRSVDYSSEAHTAYSGASLQQQLAKIQQGANGCIVQNTLMDIDWSKISPQGAPYKFSFMTIEHVDHSKTLVLYDHPAYLCNDAGTTVEKINVR